MLVAQHTFVLLAIAWTYICCQGQNPPMSNVKVTMVVILADSEGEDIDPRLRLIAKEIQKKSPELKSFQLNSMYCESLPVNKMTKVKTVEKKMAEITIKHCADANNRVTLTFKAPRQDAITYRTICGKFLPIVTRYQTSEGKRLILAIRVQPCNGH